MAATSAGGTFQGHLNILATVGVVGDLNDGQLLRGCLGSPDGQNHAQAQAQAAFSALVQRHGPMVLKVCRQVVGDLHDADDAFQATFLVLLRRAGSVRNVDSVASWLHGVVYRVSRRARIAAVERRARERRAAEMNTLRHDGGTGKPESWEELHEEIARLPARYREPIVLCYLEGLTTGAAAGRLQCAQGTVLSRLSRGREQLRARLIRRGLAPEGRLVTRGLAPDLESTHLPGPLLAATVELGTRLLERTGPVASAVPASVASLTEGVLHAMFWTKLRTAGLAGLAVATLAVGAADAIARAYPESKAGRVNRPRQAAQEPPAPKAKPADRATAAYLPLPARDELHRLLRRAAGEGIAMARAKPMPESWCLTAIAVVQAKAGDIDGARATFAEARKEGEGRYGGVADARNLWRMGHLQARSGLKDEARASLRAAVKAVPGVVGDYGKDSWTVLTLAAIAEDQARLGDRDEARRTADRLLEFSRKFFESANIRKALSVVAPQIAAALAAVGDFDAAFGWSEGSNREGSVLGEIAAMTARTLDREEARRFVREAADRLAKLKLVEERYFGLSDLAEAQARLGDIEAARRSAGAAGLGPSRGNYDMTDGQPYAFIRVASVQHEAGDIAGARETLRLAFRSISEHPKMQGRDGRCFQVAEDQIANGDLEGAARSVEAMEKARGEALAALARAYAARGDEAAARTTFARALIEARRTAQNPPGPDPAFARMRLAQVQAMAGDVAGALRIMRSSDDPNHQRYALYQIVSARATAGDVAGALRLCIEESKTPVDRRGALLEMGHGLETRLTLEAAGLRGK
ncbi:MAG: sigma-70 family RNA polymerase sigma factor [Isosphaeraceae bacterium]